MTKNSKALGAAIKLIRKNIIEITQHQLAVKCCLSISFISEIEAGYKMPGLETIETIAAGLNCEAWKLFRISTQLKECKDKGANLTFAINLLANTRQRRRKAR